MNRILWGIVTVVLFLGIGCSKPVSQTQDDYTSPTAEQVSQTQDDYTSPNIGTLKYVPAGSFVMTTPATTSTTTYVQETFTQRAFRMSEYEITREQYTKVTGMLDPSDTEYSTGQQDPVQNVSWYHALVFCNKLSMLEGLTPVYTINSSTDPAQWGSVPTLTNSSWDAVRADWSADGYRLPTEMEWMWAAMGADKENPGKVNTTGYNKRFAGDNGSNRNNSLGDYVWAEENSNKKTHPVGTKLPNELGLFDMSGNVFEWCWDWFGAYPTGATTNYRGAASGDNRVDRGGSWRNNASLADVCKRYTDAPYRQGSRLGFRVVRSN